MFYLFRNCLPTCKGGAATKFHLSGREYCCQGDLCNASSVRAMVGGIAVCMVVVHCVMTVVTS